MNVDCKKVWDQSKEKLPPHQKMITETLIEAARSYDICWICGDNEKLSFIKVKADDGREVGEILCADCAIIQKSKGAIFIEVNPINK